jgi:radical SAM protein with 4Fe4S-binding SPASM domain
MTYQNVDILIEKFVEAGVFHVIPSGGEPMAKFDLLEYTINKLTENNISTSINSNLMLATEKRMKRLFDAGLDHVLTSLNSYDPRINDYMVNQLGAFEKIVNGIKTTVAAGIRVSANMVVGQLNKDHVYQTAILAHEIGCQKFFGTRVVPAVYKDMSVEKEDFLSKKDALETLNELLRAKEDTGIMIGTLISYPLCLLSDLEKYADFVGRGCPAQRGDRMSINATGESHACVHEEESYGNVLKTDLREAFAGMKLWHDGSYRYEECQGCDYSEVCSSGCRMSSLAHNGRLDGKDHLMENKDNFRKRFKIATDPELIAKINLGMKFRVPERIRFRREDGYYLLNIRWANTIEIETDTAEFLIRQRKHEHSFDINDFGIEKINLLTHLYMKDAIVSDEHFDDNRHLSGLSINPAALPDVKVA